MSKFKDDIHEKITKDNLQDIYFSDKRPWVVAFSGGKDSTLVFQLVLEFLESLEPEHYKPVYLLISDTQVEPPVIENYIKETLDLIEKAIQKKKLPIKIVKVKPEVENSFWSKLIGKGYPSPTKWFRWCTSYLKIRPARRAIDKITRKYGSVILLLGTRKDESQERKKRMEAREYSSKGLNPHYDIPNALVSSPISEWTTEQVWAYLSENPPTWGENHDFMFKLYKQASGDECHLILDLIAPSCGGSRFGCWTCTVVKKDLSMQGFIKTGEAWMQPLNSFRDWLKEIRDDQSMRNRIRRDGSKGPGPFNEMTRKKILEKLLETEKKVNQGLISDDEIQYIQQQWAKEFDLKESAIHIANRYGRNIKEMNELKLSESDQEIIDELIAKWELQPELVQSILFLVTKKYPSLDIRGAKINLQREIAEKIETAALRNEN
jgi:DNA sulfur modification protein DndC